MSSTVFAHDSLSDALANLEAMRSRWSRSLVSHGWLVHFPNGLYIAADIDADNVVRSVRSVGIPGASHFTKEDALTLCRDGNLRNGAGEIAEPIGRIDAIDKVIAKLREAIAAMEGSDNV